jgi:hypothetical protein
MAADVADPDQDDARGCAPTSPRTTGRVPGRPTGMSGRAMTAALDRVSEVLALGARSANVEAVPANRLAALAVHSMQRATRASRRSRRPPVSWSRGMLGRVSARISWSARRGIPKARRSAASWT